MTHFFGQSAAESSILQAMQSNRMHHAWLLNGPKGVGKNSFAWRVSAHLLTHDDPGADHFSALAINESNAGAAMLAKGQHPDCHYIARGPKDDKEARKKEDGKAFEIARSIRVDQIRALQKRLNVRPSLSERRVIIIDAADDMEKNASNALLKCLEEPPENTTFFLISHQPGRLLPTIRSRCLSLHFTALSDDDMRAALAAARPDISAQEIAVLTRLGKGVPGEALALAGLDMAAIDKVLSRIVQTGDHDHQGRLALGKMLTGKVQKERFMGFLRYVPGFAATQVKHVRGDQLADAVSAWQEIGALTTRSVQLNLDPATVSFQIGGLLARLAPPR